MLSSYIRLYTVPHIFLMATSTLAASYARFQNGLSKAIVSIIKLIETLSTGDQFVAGRCLYSNEVNNVKDSFLPCKASALFQQVRMLFRSSSSLLNRIMYFVQWCP